MSPSPTPKVSRAPSFSLVWIVPVAALLIGGWMIFRELRNRGPEIVIEFAEGSGVDANKTVLEHKGVVIGKVTAVVLNRELNGVEIKVQLDQRVASLAVSGTEFWIVRPQIGLSGISGIDTLVTGVRLHLRPGQGQPANRFKGLEHEPAEEDAAAGRAFQLQSDRLGALTPGAPVFYRELKVGTVESTRLGNDATTILVRIRILTPYVNLVRTNTQFWNAGGVSLKVGLLGAEMKSTSLESLVTGGVAFATPSTPELAEPAKDGTLFTLHAEPEKEWLKWSPRIPVQSPENSPGSPSPPPSIPSLLKM